MSVQDALRFIQMVRADEVLRARVAAVDPAAPLEALAGLGAEIGLTFSPDELRDAFARDWAMRWIRYRRTDSPTADRQ